MLPTEAIQPSNQSPVERKVSVRSWFRELFLMTPAHNDHHPALRTAIGVGVPLLTLVLTGRIDRAIFASFGAFTGIFGRNEPHRQRLHHQAKAGVSLLLMIFAGIMFAHAGVGTWGIVIGATLVAGLGSLAAGFGRLKPGGSLFHIFAFGAIASVADQPPIWQAMMTAAPTVAFSLAAARLPEFSRAAARLGWSRFRLAISSTAS